MGEINVLTVIAFNIVIAIDGLDVLLKAYKGELAGKTFSVFSYTLLGWGIFNVVLILSKSGTLF